MQHIIVDFEFVQVNEKDFAYFCKNEIIEIGAVRLNDSYEFVDRFDILVKPEHSVINSFTTALTGISASSLENAPCFDEAMECFDEWIGPEKFKIYQWSENDKYQIVNECRAKGLDNKYFEFIFKHWIDIQRLYCRILNVSHVFSLERALDSLGIPLEGKMHRAVDDAYNTSSILKVMADKTEFRNRICPLREKLTPRINSSSTLGELLGEKLALLYQLAEVS